MNESRASRPGSATSARNLGRYTPLTGFLFAILAALIIFPSALNLPQENPATIAEYAPVPPDDDSPRSGEGNIGSLGIASSSSLTTGGRLPFPELAAGSGRGRNPSTKRCVGRPPRQTEDPMSPPCVPTFEGDNGGATYRGVTKNEINVVAVHDGYTGGGTLIDCTDDGGCEARPQAGSYCDVDAAPNTGGAGCYTRDTETDHYRVRMTRAFSRYFNDRYQTYGRHVHFWIYWNGANTEASKRASASENYERLKPFAAFDQGDFYGFRPTYSDAMARRNVLVFQNLVAQPRSLFQKYAPFLWSFNPDLEQLAENFVDYVCTKVAPFPVSHTNGTGTDGQPFKGKPRKYAFMYTSDARQPGLRQFAAIAKEKLGKECGVTGMDVTFPRAGFTYQPAGDHTYGPQNVAAMKSENVTTILWLGGLETETGTQADSQGYYPEIVISGDGLLEGNDSGQFQNQDFFRNAWVVTVQLKSDVLDEQPAFQACQAGDPSMTRGWCANAMANYRDFFMLFTGIQVAGPNLNPTTVDEGFHSLPRIVSTSPYKASCYFDVGDYTCVKDAMEEWYDPDRNAPGASSPGCWRMRNGGKRFIPGSWEKKDDVFMHQEDECNSFNAGLWINANPAD